VKQVKEKAKSKLFFLADVTIVDQRAALFLFWNTPHRQFSDFWLGRVDFTSQTWPARTQGEN
jgi:hypothetical protein